MASHPYPVSVALWLGYVPPANPQGREALRGLNHVVNHRFVNIVRGLSTCSYAHKAYETNTTAKNRNVGVAKGLS